MFFILENQRGGSLGPEAEETIQASLQNLARPASSPFQVQSGSRQRLAILRSNPPAPGTGTASLWWCTTCRSWPQVEMRSSISREQTFVGRSGRSDTRYLHIAGNSKNAIFLSRYLYLPPKCCRSCAPTLAAGIARQKAPPPAWLRAFECSTRYSLGSLVQTSEVRQSSTQTSARPAG
jgi:hypothetical protein